MPVVIRLDDALARPIALNNQAICCRRESIRQIRASGEVQLLAVAALAAVNALLTHVVSLVTPSPTQP